MLIASDVSKRDAGDATAWNLLELEGAPATRKNLHFVSAGPHQMNRSPRDEDFVLIDPGTNKNLVMLSCIQ